MICDLFFGRGSSQSWTGNIQPLGACGFNLSFFGIISIPTVAVYTFYVGRWDKFWFWVWIPANSSRVKCGHVIALGAILGGGIVAFSKVAGVKAAGIVKLEVSAAAMTRATTATLSSAKQEQTDVPKKSSQ